MIAEFKPMWVSLPGDTIVDILEERGWTLFDLSAKIGYPLRFVEKIIRGDIPISDRIARRLAFVLGSSVEFWMKREWQYRSALKAGPKE